MCPFHTKVWISLSILVLDPLSLSLLLFPLLLTVHILNSCFISTLSNPWLGLNHYSCLTSISMRWFLRMLLLLLLLLLLGRDVGFRDLISYWCMRVRLCAGINTRLYRENIMRHNFHTSSMYAILASHCLRCHATGN